MQATKVNADVTRFPFRCGRGLQYDARDVASSEQFPGL